MSMFGIPLLFNPQFPPMSRLRVVSNFFDGDCAAGEIHTHAREISRRSDARGAPNLASRAFPRNFAHSPLYFALPTIAIAKTRDYSQSTL